MTASKVVITGGSGFIGQQIATELLKKDYDVVSIDLVPPRLSKMMFVEADVMFGIPAHHYLEKPTYVINLAGAPIFGRWTTEKKEEIYHSRVDGTKNLVNLMKNPLYRPQALISASAVGVYGDTGTAKINERTEEGEGFLAQTAADWELAAREAENLGVRTTIIRTGHVLGAGGLMQKLRPFYKLRLVPQLGPSQSCFSWIHQEDLVRIYIESMEEPIAPDVINAVAPQFSTVGEFNRELAQATSATVLKIPSFFARPWFKDFVDELSAGQCVESMTLSDRFQFKYPSLQQALVQTIK